MRVHRTAHTYLAWGRMLVDACCHHPPPRAIGQSLGEDETQPNPPSRQQAVQHALLGGCARIHHTVAAYCCVRMYGGPCLCISTVGCPDPAQHTPFCPPAVSVTRHQAQQSSNCLPESVPAPLVCNTPAWACPPAHSSSTSSIDSTPAACGHSAACK